MFRKAALANIPLLRQMEQALKAKSDRTLPEEFFQDLLDEHFSEEEARRQWRPPSSGAATRKFSITTRRRES